MGLELTFVRYLIGDPLTVALIVTSAAVPVLLHLYAPKKDGSTRKQNAILFAQVVLPILTVLSAVQGVEAIRGDLREADLRNENTILELKLARREISSLYEDLERAVSERAKITSGVAMNSSTGLRIEEVLDQLGKVLISIENVTAKSLEAAKAVQQLNINQCEFAKIVNHSSTGNLGAQGGNSSMVDCGSISAIFGEESN
ncbi:hypothetical protein [Terasakiella pusilla]|uniref:hypothetical protein n=1 Tax=Terasakiella pusilla TaxID=64973 RepID=UPI003AA8DD2C